MTDIFSKILLALKNNAGNGDFIDVSELLIDIDIKNLKAACDTLEKENKIEVKQLGEYFLAFGDGSHIDTRENKLFARIKPAGLKYLQNDNGRNIIIKAGDGGVNGDGGDLVIKAGDGHLGGKGGDVNINAGDGIHELPKRNWFEKYWWGFVIPLFLGLILLFIEYGWLSPSSSSKAPIENNSTIQTDTFVVADKQIVIDKTVKEVFTDFDETIKTLESKYASISALDYANDYFKKEFINIQSRIDNKSYINRFARNPMAWTPKDIVEINALLKNKTIDRMKEILEDTENKAEGPFVFSDEKIKMIEKDIYKETEK